MGQKMVELSAHRVFGIPHLLHEIFSTLASDSTGRRKPRRLLGAREEPELAWALPFAVDHTKRRTLVNAARTCKRFSSPALDALWRAMDSIIPLLSILPCLQFHGSNNYAHDSRYTLSETIQAENWTRLKQYARRILYLHCNISPKLDEFAFIFLMPHLKGEALLPSLRSLSFPCSPILLLLTSSSLRDVNITALGDKGTSSFLPALLDSAPHLEKFSTLSTCSEMSPDAWRTLAQFSNLHTLRIGSWDLGGAFDASAFSHIFSLRQLVDLGLFFSETSKTAISLRPHVSSQSYSLRSLTIRANPLFVSDVLACVSTAALETLKITYRSVASDPLNGERLWPGSLSPLSQWSDSLVHLELRDGSSYIQDRLLTRDLSLLQPLHNLKKLTTVSIVVSSVTFDLPNDAWGELATWWPGIQKLWIISGKVERPEGGFPTLEAFALHCPKLSDLYLSLNLSSPSQSPPITCHGLQRLCVANAYGGNPHYVARHLDCLFPSLDLITQNPVGEGVYDDGGYSVERWETVKQILRTCQRVRADHEKRLLLHRPDC